MLSVTFAYPSYNIISKNLLSVSQSKTAFSNLLVQDNFCPNVFAYFGK